MNFYDSMFRWAVPVFTMISGALFLSKDIPVRKLYGKYIFRILTAFVFWSFVYAAIGYMDNGDIVKAAENFVKGHYHMWFLPVIAGLYMIVPLWRRIAESESLTKYFLAAAFFFTFFLPEIVYIISIFSEYYGEFAKSIVERFTPKFAEKLAGYFLLGYFLNRVNISRRAERLIYIAGIAGYAATVLLTLYASHIKGEPIEIFYAEQSAHVLCEAVAVFTLFRAKFNRPSRIIKTLAQYSFGAYLVHPVILIYADKLGWLDTLATSPVISIPVTSVILFVISFAISALLNRIPVIKKYIV